MLRASAGVLAGVSVLFFSAPPIWAQDDAVVVTATRFADSKRNLPVGVTVITSDDLRKSATSNLSEVLAQYGLLHIRDNSGSPNQQVDLRGFGVTGDQNTLILVDGLRLSENEQVPAQLSSIPLESIERIEIVRGSGAVLYGGGAVGGTINIITKQPDAGARRGYLLGRVGGYGTKEGRAGIATQGDTLGFSLDASSEDTDGYRRNNNFRQNNLSGAVEGRGSAGRAYLRFNANAQELALPGQLTEAQIQSDRRQASTPNNDSERTGGTVVLGGATNLGRHELAIDLSGREKHATSSFGETTFFPPSFIDTQVGLVSLQPRGKFLFDAFGRTHDVVLGLDWEDWTYVSRFGSSPDTLNTPFSLRRGEQENRSLYGQANLWLAQSTRLVLGARTQRSEDRLAEEVFPIDDRRVVRHLEAYEAALRQGFGAGWSAYGKYGKSFRLANFDDNACFFPPCATTLLEPQTALGGELGVEYERAGWRARAAVYQQDLENEIYFSSLVFANINLQPTRRRGFELEAAWHAAAALDLRASLAWMEAKFKTGVYGGVDVSGKDVPQVPDTIATLGAAWTFAPRSRLIANARYVGEQRYDNDQANVFRKQPDYTLVDLKAEHTSGSLTFALEVKNLFDVGYYSYGLWDGVNSFVAYPAAGRAAYVTVAYRL
jgi:iron complex outermembrane receptor protein